MPAALVLPTNSFIVSFESIAIREYIVGANATAAEMLPGSQVIYDTTADAIKEGGDEADNVIGILMEKPNELITTAYAVGDVARVIVGGVNVILAVREATSGGATTPGTPMVAAADGLLKIMAVGTIGAQGMIIGVAQEIHSDVGSIARVMMKLLLQAEALPAT